MVSRKQTASKWPSVTSVYDVLQVEFQIGEQKTNSKQVAVNVKVLFRSTSNRCQGYVATLKENYGFIENEKHDQEFFFHFR